MVKKCFCDGDLSDLSESSEPVNSPVNSLWLSQNSQTILMIFGSLLTKVKPRKIESERRSASKTSNLRISLFTSIKDRHCIQTTRILVNRPAINAYDPMPSFRRIWCELRSVTARTQQICLNPHHRQCWTNVVTQQTQNICITFVQLWPDVVPALYNVIGLQMFCVCWVGDVIMVIPWFMSIRHRNFPFLIKKCSMLIVKPSAFDVSEQSYGKYFRSYLFIELFTK